MERGRESEGICDNICQENDICSNFFVQQRGRISNYVSQSILNRTKKESKEIKRNKKK